MDSFNAALDALFSEEHQAKTPEALKLASSRRKLTIEDMNEYFKRCNLTSSLPDVSVVHIAGTKGKGSTACFCESILRSHGKRTALFTSPHLVDIRERMRLDGRPISKEVFGQVYQRVKTLLIRHANLNEDIPTLPGYFRMLMLMFMYLVQHASPRIDIVILEVGMGGRYDATNAWQLMADQYACGVCKLDYDHVRVLGNTLEKIAWEKGGIFKKYTNGPSQGNPTRFFALRPEQDSVAQVLLDCASEAAHDLEFVTQQAGDLCGYKLGLAGTHQHENAELAIRLCKAILGSSNQSLLAEALSSATWPGRCQTVYTEKTTLYLDGAHTKESMSAGAGWYQSQSSGSRSKSLIFNCSHERNPIELLELLLPLNFHHVYFCPADSERPSAEKKKTSDELLREAGHAIDVHCKGAENTWQQTLGALFCHLREKGDCELKPTCHLSVREALSEAQQVAESEIFVTGSLYLVGSVLSAVNWSEAASPSVLNSNS